MDKGNNNSSSKSIIIKRDDSQLSFFSRIKRRVLPLMGISIALLIYFAWMFALYFVFKGSHTTKSILIAILIYQFFFARRSLLYLDFVKYFKPWEHFKSYELKIEEEIDKTNSLFCCHPHGVLHFGPHITRSLNETIFDSIFCGSRVMIMIPVSGLFARWMGLQGVDNTSFKGLMKKGKNIMFIPGGFEEATLTDYRKDRVFIKERKGFIKYALEYGYKVHPIYTFGENKIFYTINLFEKFRLFLNRYKIPGVFFYGKYLFMPNPDINLMTVVGKSIQFPRIEKPSDEDVNKYHKIYIDALTDLYNSYKDAYGASEKLEVL